MFTQPLYFVFLLLSYASVNALTRYVDGTTGTSDGSNGYFQSVQAALTNSLSGVTQLEIIVYPTTTYQVDYMVESTIPQNITIRSSSTSVATINCAVTNAGFIFQNKAAVAFSYLKMINCKSVSSTIPLQFISVSSLTIQNCVFDKFNVGGVGGAVTMKNVASAFLDYVTVTSSTSANGGGIYIENSVAWIAHSAFATNSATDKGGAIFIGTSASWGRPSFGVNITNSNIYSNYAASRGGAVAVVGDAASQISVRISQTDIKSNQAIYGGALYVSDASVSVSSGKIQNNSVPCSTGGMHGGAAYVLSAGNSITSLSFDGSSFTSNLACKSGGAVYYDVTLGGVAPSFKNLQFSSNSAQYTAGVFTNGTSVSYNTCNFTANSGSEVLRVISGSVDAKTLYIFNNSAAAINCSYSTWALTDPHIWGNQPDFPCPTDYCTFAVVSPSQLAAKFNSCATCSRDACTYCAGDSQSPCTGSSTPASPSPTSSVSPSPTRSPSSTPSPSVSATSSPSATPSPTSSPSTSASISASSSPSLSPLPSSSPVDSTTTSASTTGGSVTTDGNPTTSDSGSNGDQNQKSSSNLAMIAGGAAGGGVLLSIIIVLIVLLLRKRKQPDRNATAIGLNPDQNNLPMEGNYQRFSSNTITRNSYEFDTSYQVIGSGSPNSSSHLSASHLSGGHHSGNSSHLSVSSIPRGQETPYSTFSAFTFPLIEGAVVIPYQDLDCQKELGRGSFGVVFKGVYEGRTVAVKQILGELNERQVNAIADEARIMTSVPPHPNIISLIGVVSYPPCIVSKVLKDFANIQFYQNGSLLNYLLDKQKNLSKQDTCKIIYGITAGMAHLAKYKVVHRDLAARNILLDENMNAIVSDFGFARALQEDEHSGKTYTSIGPIKWMALEALTQRIYSEKSDVWSWAVTVWECLTRQPPWPGSDNVNTILAVSSGRRLPIPEICSTSFAQLMQSCWKVDPNARPTFQELLDEVTKMGDSIIV